MRSEINGLVEMVELRTDIPKSALKLLQMHKKWFIESVAEWREAESDEVCSSMCKDEVRTTHKKYINTLMKTLGLPVEEEPLDLRV